MQAELRPRQHLAELFQSFEPARQRDERIRQVSHERLAFVHGAHHVKLRQPVVPDLAFHESFWNDSNRLAAHPQHRVGEHAHQTHIAAAVNEPEVATHQSSGERWQLDPGIRMGFLPWGVKGHVAERP